VLLGYSVKHRRITAVQIGDPDSPRRVLVVGCIHGDEPAGIVVTRALAAARMPPELDLWLVPDLNPDGRAAGTRTNARGVDLNRNFPYRWRHLGAPGSLRYAGPHALSEPESRVARRLLQAVRPTLGIWYHQALAVVDTSQGPIALERRYAAITGIGLLRLPDYPGSAVGYENHVFGPTAFVVELPAGPLTGLKLALQVHAVLEIATHATPIHA
jgi:protein MpaA